MKYLSDVGIGKVPEQGALDVEGDIYSNGEKVRVGGGFKVGSFSAGASTGNISITNVGFTPKLVEFEWAASSSQTLAGNGVMDDSGGQFAQCSYTTTSATNTEASTTRCFITADASATNREFAYVSMDADGFTINCTKAASNTAIGYKAYA